MKIRGEYNICGENLNCLSAYLTFGLYLTLRKSAGIFEIYQIQSIIINYSCPSTDVLTK